MKDPVKMSMGKKSRIQGNNFEKKVRENLVRKGYVVDKWTNNIVPETGVLIPVRPYWIGSRMVMNQGGFPDFVRWRKESGKVVIEGVESKMNGTFTTDEQEKARALLKYGVFSKIWIAYKIKSGGRIVVMYEDFEEKYGKQTRID